MTHEEKAKKLAEFDKAVEPLVEEVRADNARLKTLLYVVITGDIATGLRITGPFGDYDTAWHAGDEMDENWLIATMTQHKNSLKSL